MKVPDVSEKDLNDALLMLHSKGLQVGKKIEITDEEITKGNVIKTDPEAGSTVKENSKITIYLSSGKEKYDLSDYVGRQYDDVVLLLDNNNFKDIKKNEVYNDSNPGTIISQSPSGGQKIVPEDTVLEFEVSKGPEKITLTDLTQYNLKGAQDYASTNGLILDASQEQYDDNIPVGNVISQSPAAGTEMNKGDKVSVVISKGKEEKPPKTVTKDISIPYEPATPGQQQTVQIYIEDMNHSMTEPAETFTISDNKKLQIELTIPFGKTAGYKVVRDNTVITDEAINYADTP
ncbi:PASTA domain-containing protein [Neobacillus pocheonensis]|uniref:PASTA domain-containing protein n=1 Tax=Neobacillus pocheonensis TaxID=363869 RepID=A0ABT0WAV3_9BACI|nr:PASTA domain-containing protein [Neobacillus pocheonensis]